MPFKHFRVKIIIHLSCLNTACEQAWRLYSDHFILFNEDSASVLSVLTIKQFVMHEKCVYFQRIEGNTIGRYPAFLGLFVWIEKDREHWQMQHMRS